MTQKTQKMLKNKGFFTHKTCSKAHHKQKILLGIVCITIISFLTLVFADDWTKNAYYSDDFGDSSINSTLWVTSGTVTEFNGYITIKAPADGITYLATKYDYNTSTDYVVNFTMSNIAGSGAEHSTLISVCNKTAGLTATDIVNEAGQPCYRIFFARNDVYSYSNFTITINSTNHNYTLYDGAGNINYSYLVNNMDYHYLVFISYTSSGVKNTTLHDFSQYESSAVITLNSPSNNDDFIYNGVTFNVSATSGVGIANISLYINGTINDTNTVTGTSNNTAFLKSIGIGNHTWFASICNINNNCTNSSSYSFEIHRWLENSQTYNSVTTEGASEQFTLNMTYNSSLWTDIGADFIYNNTVYSATKGGSGDTITFTRTVTVPSINESQNKSFYWTIDFISGASHTYSNSTAYSQTISNFSLDDCSVNSVVLLNLTLRDEETQAKINETTYNTSIEVDVDIRVPGSSVSLVDYSQNYTKNINPLVCLESDLSNTSYEMDVQILYQGDAYAAEFYYIQNHSLTNSSLPQMINLYDLKSTDAQKFLITFKDSNFLPVSNALINIQRKYVADGVFRSVEIPKTDESGQATGSFDLTGVVYTIVVTKYGETLATFDNIAVVCQDQVIGDCRINLNIASSTIDFTDWEERGGITYTMSFNKVARTITAVYTTTDGTAKTVLLNATKYDMFGNDTVCTDSLTSASGTLTCNIPASYGNVTVLAELYSNGNLITTRIYSITADVREIFGTEGLIIFLLLMITIPLMLITSGVGVIIGVFAGLILSYLLNLYSTGNIIGTASTIIWVIIAGIIVIWKISRREG